MDAVERVARAGGPRYHKSEEDLMAVYSSTPVGFIGLGAMGEPMALNLAKAGTPLVVWNRSPSKCEGLARVGAAVAKQAAEVFSRCDVVILMLVDGAAMDAVLGRRTSAFADRVKGRTLISMATTAPSYSKALAADIRAEDGRYVEAPVSGSRKPAEAGKLVAMLAGEREHVASVRALLAPMCRSVIACGPVPRREGRMTVRTERNGRVLTVIHSRPEARNAVDPEHADALYDAFVAFDADEEADVAVFWGEGGAFCAGADLKSLAPSANASSHRSLEFPKGGSPVPRGPMGPSRLRLGKPVIAAIEGPAVAGGMELSLWADCRIMAEDAYMGVYSRRWGLPLTDGGTVRLPRLVGEGRALELIMTGRKVDADECLRICLCEMVVPNGQARQAAEDMAHQITRFPQASLRADRRSVYLQYGLPEDAALEKEWYNCKGVFKAEGAAGVARFAEGAGRHGDFGNITRPRS